MNTQTHILVAAALFTEPGQRSRNIAALAGGFIPDLPIYSLWLWSKINAIPEHTVWREMYWSDPWKSLVDASHSIPIYLALLLIGMFALTRPQPPTVPAGATLSARWHASVRQMTPLTIFALAGLTHIAGDFPVHVADAHAHFWPLSDWRFHSPVSYWDPAHYGRWFSLFEITLGVSLAVIIFRRFQAWWVRGLMVAATIAYFAVPAYFILVVGHHQP